MHVQKRIASQLLKCSPNRVTFQTDAIDEIKEAITKADIRVLIKRKVITRKPYVGSSRVRARKIQKQKAKGRRTGVGSRKGKSTARNQPKSVWMAKIRVQRTFLKSLREKGIIDPKLFRDLYLKSKGGFFRSRRHLGLYIKEKMLHK